VRVVHLHGLALETPPIVDQPRGMDALDPALVALARGQHGMVTTRQLAQVGLAAPDLVALVARGILRHPGRGLYAVASLSSDDPLGWHRQLVAGAFLLYPDAVLTGTSAILAHDLPVWGAPVVRPQLLRPRERSGGMTAFHVRRTNRREAGASSPWGPCVPLGDALVQLALDAGTVPGVVSADAALRLGLATPDGLAAAVERVRTWPRSNRVSAMLSLADGRRESVGESRSAVTLAFGGIELEPQVTITDERGRFVARVDFVVRGSRVVVEFDGRVKYTDTDGTSLFEEKKREDRLRRLGYVVVRLIWADLETPGRAVAKVRHALALAA
jgi:very-short-patch-repair endonuclease